MVPMEGFTPDSEVLLVKGVKRAVDLVRGDVTVGGGVVACVVVVHAPPDAPFDVGWAGGALVTPTTPVYDRAQSRWAHVNVVASANVPLVVNVLFRKDANQGTLFFADGTQVAVLAHGLVVAPTLFGTERARQALSRMPGFRRGRVEVAFEDVVRDPDTGELVGLTPLMPPWWSCCG